MATIDSGEVRLAWLFRNTNVTTQMATIDSDEVRLAWFLLHERKIVLMMF